MPYFRRAGHVGLVLGVSFFTWGLGGLAYWLARRKHLACSRCGLGWGNASRALAVTGPEPKRRPLEAESDEALPSTGIKRRVLGTAIVLFASAMVFVGLLEGEIAAFAVGSVLGGGGLMTFCWGWQSLQNRRNAIIEGLQRKILKLAISRDGRLTVTEVASDVNLSLTAAEKILESMDDGFRVRSDISPDGVLYYEFLEIVHRGDLGPVIDELGSGAG